jgi:hypothetical protein
LAAAKFAVTESDARRGGKDHSREAGKRHTGIFTWTMGREMAMVELKARLTTAPILLALDFSERGGRVFLAVDASTTIGWGAALEQVSEGELRRRAQFESS